MVESESVIFDDEYRIFELIKKILDLSNKGLDEHKKNFTVFN